jgi:hypothetical protein
MLSCFRNNPQKDQQQQADGPQKMFRSLMPFLFLKFAQAYPSMRLDQHIELRRSSAKAIIKMQTSMLSI